ncbi:HNH endonuclease [Bifidobacterium adolescentis]|nr:HNH endonuclease [Bifidobacterium adolescentis]KAB5766073.1 HNH endonuclease [Bifidobacterium adolescentis]KAB5783370.1 HNH endonuclease [Bifidobacterium adolescentis]
MMAFALYRILPSGKWDKRNPTVQRLADHIRRSPSAVALKLGNLASLDENRTTKGLTNCSRLDREIWEEYAERGDALVFESSQLLASALNGPDNRPAANGDSVVEQIVSPQIGYDRPALVTQRVNQQYFRNTLIHNYHDHCCITGIAIDPLLVASHIKPWKDSSPTEKVAASNGLLLNAFHDRTFDQGLITLDNDFAIHVSPHVEHTEINDEWLYRYDGQRISLPVVCSPSREFLEFHREHIYQL